jgi:hypothetical protein
VKLDTRDAKDDDAAPPEMEDLTASFELFYESERDGLFASLYLMTRDPHDAEELVHDASRGSGSGGVACATWIARRGTSTEPRSTRSGTGTEERRSRNACMAGPGSRIRSKMWKAATAWIGPSQR